MLKTAKSFKLSRQAIFSILAIVMALLVLLFIIYSIGFLASSLDTAFDITGPGSPEERFDIKGYEALKLKSL